MTDPSATPSRVRATLDDLVAGARSDRDGVFNTLDAVSRRTEAASAHLVAEAERLIADRRAAPADVAGVPDRPVERDTRFDPEDEWELASGALAGGAAAGNTPRAGRDEYNDDDDGGPHTWLR